MRCETHRHFQDAGLSRNTNESPRRKPVKQNETIYGVQNTCSRFKNHFFNCLNELKNTLCMATNVFLLCTRKNQEPVTPSNGLSRSNNTLTHAFEWNFFFQNFHRRFRYFRRNQLVVKTISQNEKENHSLPSNHERSKKITRGLAEVLTQVKFNIWVLRNQFVALHLVQVAAGSVDFPYGGNRSPRLDIQEGAFGTTSVISRDGQKLNLHVRRHCPWKDRAMLHEQMGHLALIIVKNPFVQNFQRVFTGLRNIQNLQQFYGVPLRRWRRK
jgi:hypothetical protein